MPTDLTEPQRILVARIQESRMPGVSGLRVCGRGRMTGYMVLAGCWLHVDLYRVRETDDGQVFDCDQADDADMHHTAAGADGRWETVTIRGVEYAPVLTPFC